MMTQKDYRNKRRERGLCVDCGSETPNRRCKDCTDKENARTKKRLHELREKARKYDELIARENDSLIK